MYYPESEQPIRVREKHYSLVWYVLKVITAFALVGYEVIITDSTLRTSLAIPHLISKVRL